MKILLVHGAAHDENCWNELLPELANYKLDVHTLTLRGHGANKKHAYAVSMKSYAADVCNKARDLGEPCVVIGHSMGGAVISAAAEAEPELFSQLIFLAAFALPKQTTHLASYSKELVKLCPERTNPKPHINFLSGTASYDTQTSIDSFYGQYQGDAVALVNRNVYPQPIRPFLSPLRWSDERLGIIPKDYIECTEDNALPIATQRAMQKNMHFQRIESLNCDHSPFASMPQNLAAVIAALVKNQPNHE